MLLLEHKIRNIRTRILKDEDYLTLQNIDRIQSIQNTDYHVCSLLEIQLEG